MYERLKIAALIVVLMLTVTSKSFGKFCTLDFNLDFKLNNSVFYKTYLDNDSVVRLLFDSIYSIGIENIDSVVVVSYSSPEGSYANNVSLSQRRAMSMKKFFDTNFPEFKEKLVVRQGNESWFLFKEAILADTLISDQIRLSMLEILDSQDQPDVKKRKLKNLDRSKTWNYFVNNYFQRLRVSAICLSYNEFYYAVPVIEDSITLNIEYGIDTIAPAQVPFYLADQRKEKKSIFAIKTNLLFDAVTALNVALEVPIGKRFSVVADYLFPWWNGGVNGNEWALQISHLGFETKLWIIPTYSIGNKSAECKFDRTALTGLFVGLYCFSNMYDVQWRTKGCYQGEMWSAGVAVGYAWPVGNHFNLEAQVNVGYVSTDYKHYYPGTEYEALYGDRSRIGKVSGVLPTKAALSLVWNINRNKTIKYW